MKASRHRRRRAIIQVALFCTTQHQRWDIPFQWAVPAKNSDTEPSIYTSGMSYVARYDGTTGTLYLNGYNGVANIYTRISTQNPGMMTIEVESDSKITVNDTGDYPELTERRGFDVFEQLVISGNSKLTIDVKCSGKSYGIYARKGMNITAPLEVNVSVNFRYQRFCWTCPRRHSLDRKGYL